MERNSLLRDEAQGAAQQMTQAYQMDIPAMSEHATKRLARKMDFI
jgi:hypothetical protein